MRRSLESMGSSRNMDVSDHIEGENWQTIQPESFEDHLKSLERMENAIDSLLTIDDQSSNEADGSSEALDALRQKEIEKKRAAVLAAFDNISAFGAKARKAKSAGEVGELDDRIATCKNRVHETGPGLMYNGIPNVFRTKPDSVYRITGFDQLADIVNSGHVRPKEGRVKGGHKDEVFWSLGGDGLNYIDKRPIIETSAEVVKDGQMGALSLDDLSAIWVTNDETGERENKLDFLKQLESQNSEDNKISQEELMNQLKESSSDISLVDLSASF